MRHSKEGSKFVRDMVEFSLLRTSPFTSHMNCGINDRSFLNWVHEEAKIFPKNITQDCFGNDEIIFSKNSKFSNCKDSHILIIGGGPSTLDTDFSQIKRDFTWSVNHFFLNPVINKLKIDMAMIMGEPDITSKEFLDYRDKFEPMIGFEFHERWHGYKFDDYENYFLMHTDFYSKLGACVRMIIFACFLQAKKVSFVGLDGPKYIKKGDHAFQKNKTTLPVGFSEQLYAWHYSLFWDYIKRSFDSVKFENLGYGQEYHPV